MGWGLCDCGQSRLSRSSWSSGREEKCMWNFNPECQGGPWGLGGVEAVSDPTLTALPPGFSPGKPSGSLTSWDWGNLGEWPGERVPAGWCFLHQECRVLFHPQRVALAHSGSATGKKSSKAIAAQGNAVQDIVVEAWTIFSSFPLPFQSEGLFALPSRKGVKGWRAEQKKESSRLWFPKA